MKNNTQQNLRLGIFVISGLLILVIGIYFIGKRQNMFGNSTKISTVFKNVNGLQLGNNVRYAGVNVGTVKGITIMNDTSICVDMYINENTIGLIKRNSLATVNSDGLVGSMIINIIPGEGGIDEPVHPGDTLESLSKIATADMLTTLNTTNENAALLTADLLKITNSINAGEGVLGSLLKDEKMSQDIKSSLANLQQTTRNAAKTLNEINKIIGEVNLQESVAGVLLTDTTSAKELSTIISSLSESAENIQQVSSNLEDFSAEIKNGEGALNHVINDTSFVNSLDNTLENVESASAKFNENMEALKHNILFRGYFRRIERQKARQMEDKDTLK
ncbi:MAG: MlaD family protein [Salegentibacter sp.]